MNFWGYEGHLDDITCFNKKILERGGGGTTTH